MKKYAKRFLLFCLMLAVSCTMIMPTTSFAASKKPVKITLKASKSTVTVGSKVKVKVKAVKPKSASKAVTFKSSNKKIATVSSKGTVTGKKAGKVTITATSKKNKKVKAKVKITVKNPVAKSIKISATCKNICVGTTCNVSVTSVSPKLASKAVTYTTSDREVATVTSKGLIKGEKVGTATITAISKTNKKVKDSVKINVVNSQQGVVTNTVNLSNKPAGKVAKVWLPIPTSDDNQKIRDVKVDAPKATKVIKSAKDSAGNTQCYIEWDETVAPEDRVATLSFHVTRKEVVRPDLVEKGSVDKNKFAKYLKETEKSGSFKEGSIVKTTADKIVKDAGAKTVLQKTKAIFDWEVNNLHRDNSVTGCGLGDVETILTSTKGGKCTDLNSVFVALLRAEGIPAREMFGVRINAEDITGNQHCRAQFYLPGTGWVEADPADVLKQALTDGKSNTDADWKSYIEPVKDKYWGGNNENWVMLSMERDITLSPAQSAKAVEGGILNADGTLNNFGYPYAEFDGEYVSCYSAKDFTYTYTFAHDDDKDCC